MVTVAIHQPNYLPWLGFFKKMMNSDIFVLLDDVQFEKKNYTNRNKIRTKDGSIWLTIPVNAHRSSSLNEVRIDNTKNWAEKHKKSILSNYSKAIFFTEHENFIDQLYEKTFDLLININVEIIEYIMEKLQIKTKTILSSELNVSGQGSDRILNICKALNADVYITGTNWAKDNLRVEDFTKNNIDVQFQTFQHPIYKQLHGDFIPNMAIIDLLFNEGKNSRDILVNSKTI